MLPTPDKPEQKPQCKKEAEAKGFTVDDTCYPWFPTPNKAQQPAAHSPEWFGAYDAQGKLRATFEFDETSSERSVNWSKAFCPTCQPIVNRHFIKREALFIEHCFNAHAKLEKTQSHADKLAEALREIGQDKMRQGDAIWMRDIAKEALAAYEKEAQ